VLFGMASVPFQAPCRAAAACCIRAFNQLCIPLHALCGGSASLSVHSMPQATAQHLCIWNVLGGFLSPQNDHGPLHVSVQPTSFCAFRQQHVLSSALLLAIFIRG
jgi:hypothetical protein